jgi:uncharacterized protein
MELKMLKNVMRSLLRAFHLAMLAVVLAAMSSAAQAQKKPSAAEMATAKELVKLTSATALFNPLIAGVVEQAKLVFLQQNPGLSKDLNEIAGKIRTDLSPRFSELTDEVARLYAQHFTEQELKAILAFYKSPVGQKTLREQPQVIEASMKYAQDWANNLSDEVIARMRDELKKKGHDL